MSKKTTNPRFQAIYKGNWRGMKGWGWGAYLFREAFASLIHRGSIKNLPKNEETEYAIIFSDDKVHRVELILTPFVEAPVRMRWGKEVKIKSSKHRVFIMCDRCDHKIPAGRIHQHTC